MKKHQPKQKKKNKTFLIVTILITLMIFGGLALWSNQSSNISSAAPKPTASLELLIKQHSPVKGSENAKVTIVEFLDPECEACRAMHPIMKTLLTEYEGKVKVVIRYLPFHGNSKLAAAALEEAREQGKYYEALDILFEKQPEWADHGHPKPELIQVFLQQIGIDGASLDRNKLIAKHGWKVDLDHQDGVNLGVRRTPTFFVNGKQLDQIGYSSIKTAIEEALIQQ